MDDRTLDDMDEFQMLRSLLLRIGRQASPGGALARAIIDWAEPHRGWLLGDGIEAPDWNDLMAAIAQAPSRTELRPDVLRPDVLRLGDALADLLGLDPADRALLVLMIACDRLPRVQGLAQVAARYGFDLPALLGELAGVDPQEAGRFVRRSAVLRLGLADFMANRRGEVEVRVRWTLERLLDAAPAAADEMIDLLVGQRRPARLALEDFGGVVDAGFLTDLLAGAVKQRATGINILIHGPPGTGKTELACTLAAAAGAALHAVGEVDDDGDEPTRWERVNALQIAQRMLAGPGGAILLFDEMEDLIGEARPSGGDWFARREGSKVFINRMLESNAVPVIWTTNAIGNIDDAILRRMSFVLRMGMPSPAKARRMLARIADDEGVAPGEGFETLLVRAPETASVLRVATRAGRLAGAADGGVRSAEALVRALRGGPLPDDDMARLDLDLFEADRPIAPLMEAIAASGAADVSLLLAGPPGTGKTALAHHLAQALDRPLLVRRTSDLLSKWVGGTERAIAGAFEEARQRDAVLLFDEADSLLFDRRTARASWEVTQVNELLTWLDRHPLPVIAATNHAAHLDPAALRRFVFKLTLKPLAGAKLAQAFTRFFGAPPPAALADLRNLTPGDFAVVARQLRFHGAVGPAELVERLRVESEIKPEGGGPIGF